MTDIDIDAIRERERAATPGPWKTGDRFGGRSLGSSVVVLAGNLPPARLDSHRNGRNDAVFIAAARTDVPALLAKVDELTAQRDLNSDLLDGTAKALGIDLEDPDVHYAFNIPTKVAELVAALTQFREQAATHANQIGRLVAENARLRQQRDAHTDVVEAAKAWRDSDDIQLIGVDEIGEELVAAVDALPKAEATR